MFVVQELSQNYAKILNKSWFIFIPLSIGQQQSQCHVNPKVVKNQFQVSTGNFRTSITCHTTTPQKI